MKTRKMVRFFLFPRRHVMAVDSDVSRSYQTETDTHQIEIQL